MFWNKTLLKWEEPRFAQKHIAKQLRIKDYLWEFGRWAIKLFAGSYLVFWFIGWLSPRRTSHSFFDVDLLLIALFIVGLYFLVWLMTLAGSRLSKPQVSLREKNLVYISLEGSANIPYKKMQSFWLQKVNLEENEYFVLRVKDRDGDEIFIEVDQKIDNESIIEILKSKNIEMKPPLVNVSNILYS